MKKSLVLKCQYLKTIPINGAWQVIFYVPQQRTTWPYPIRDIVISWSKNEGLSILLSTQVEYECVFQYNRSSDKPPANATLFLQKDRELIQTPWQLVHIRPFGQLPKQNTYRIKKLDLDKKDEAGILDMGGQKLQKLPQHILSFKKLEAIFLNHNQLSTLPQSIQQLKNIRQLDLSYNTFQHLPLTVCNLQNLQSLSMSYNLLEVLPKEIAQLQQLKILRFQHNQLKALPEELGQLTALEELDLHGNQIEVLPKALQGLKQLRVLSLGLVDHQGNPLKQLPKWISTLKNLEEISLAKTKIRELPESIHQLEKLKTLWLPKTFGRAAILNLKSKMPHLSILQ